MKLFRSALLLMGETGALGWFVLRDMSFLVILPLIPLGVAFYALHRMEEIPWLHALMAVFSAVLTAFVVSIGIFDGAGFFTLLCLLFAVALFAVNVGKRELERISGWWMAAFLLIFIAMTVATLPGIHLPKDLPSVGSLKDVVIFYLLVLIEPLGMGKSYRASPLALGLLLLPFSLLSYLVLGSGAFAWAEYPYLSVWAGVTISAFHHIEGIILCLFYGVGAFRLAHFFQRVGCDLPQEKIA